VLSRALGVKMQIIDGRKLDGIQYLRALAAFMVVVHHTLEMAMGAVSEVAPHWLILVGAAGVDIFFVISGFIMMYTSFKSINSPTPLSFLKHRIIRIYPLYLLCLVVMLTVMAMGFLANHTPDVANIISSIFLFPDQDRIIFVAWTLEYEIYFYLVFSITLLLKKPLASVLATGIILIFAFMLSVSLDGNDMGWFFENPVLFEFVLGMVLAYLYLKCGLNGFHYAIMLAAFAVIIASPFFVVFSSTIGLNGWDRFLWWGLPSFFICGGMLRGVVNARPLHKILMLLGDSSYSLYLTHIFWMAFYGLLFKVTDIGSYNQVPFVIAILFACYITSFFSYQLFEKPVLKRVRKWI
tara:strand:+ start:14587 stop:15642 length:1056 start_codon:yes stop_codon:yes gene_type:complete